MHVRKPRYDKETFARMGTELYEKKIRPLVEEGNFGRLVVIDVESGDYAVADESLEAADVLIARNHDAQLWCVRIGHFAVDKFGGVDTREKR